MSIQSFFALKICCVGGETNYREASLQSQYKVHTWWKKENDENPTHTHTRNVRQNDFIIRFFSFRFSFPCHVSETLRQRKMKKITPQLHASLKGDTRKTWTSLFLLESYEMCEDIFLQNFCRDRAKEFSLNFLLLTNTDERVKSFESGLMVVQSGFGWRKDVIYILMQFPSSVNFEQDLGRSFIGGDF